MNRQVRKLTEGAMMCALFGLVLMINRQFAGILEIFFVYVLPLPLVVYTVKHGFKSGAVCAVSICFMSLMISTLSSMVYSIVAVLIGLVYGELCRRKFSNGVLISVTMVLTMILEVMCCIVFAGVFGYDIHADAQLLMETFAASGMQLPGNLGVKFFLLIAVLSVILTGVLEGILVHVFANVLMKRLKMEIVPISPIVLWNVPKWVGYVAAVCFASNYAAQLLHASETVQLCTLAAGTIGSLVLVFFGYVACLMMGMVKYKKNLTLILIVLFIFIWPMYVVLGYFYIVSDSFRREITRREDDHE
ncbi:MAG: DUF2232 domain-containing protein [Erysipelotrichaceae bacterium]|nr:DUF2232 domain-containing protein [Erysipelotrichaceae bacterium]